MRSAGRAALRCQHGRGRRRAVCRAVGHARPFANTAPAISSGAAARPLRRQVRRRPSLMRPQLQSRSISPLSNAPISSRRCRRGVSPSTCSARVAAHRGTLWPPSASGGYRRRRRCRRVRAEAQIFVDCTADDHAARHDAARAGRPHSRLRGRQPATGRGLGAGVNTVTGDRKPSSINLPMGGPSKSSSKMSSSGLPSRRRGVAVTPRMRASGRASIMRSQVAATAWCASSITSKLGSHGRAVKPAHQRHHAGDLHGVRGLIVAGRNDAVANAEAP